ncbi:MAG: DNA methyltransferase, partial [bacterium]|nr:DNA methyltransferase [bacterium]
ILKYSKPGELVLDYFCGAGTTAIECKISGRRCIGIDINKEAIELAKRNVSFSIEKQELSLWREKEQVESYEPELFVGDARNLSFLNNNSVDLICAHPPYANVIHYTNSTEGDLSFLEVDDFLIEMSKVAKESFRVLKRGRQCAILIGDLRKRKHVIPLGFKLIDVYLNAGFKLRELIIKRQHNCKTTGFWYKNSIKYNFLLLAHEYLLVFEKPMSISIKGIKEQEIKYNTISYIPTNVRIKRKSDGLESTTVWLFPEKKFEEKLNKNVVKRYSRGNNYSIITLVSGRNVNQVRGHNRQKEKDLLFIKSHFLENITPFLSAFEGYLQRIKEIVEKKMVFLKNQGFLVVQTRDVRIGGYIEPLGKKIIDILSNNKNLYLKEVVVVAEEGVNFKTQDFKEYLKIAHHYLLVYEVKK